ncbi:MAG: hypothetical protein ACI4DY_11610 [Monoglobaceae bacterium]
MIFTAAAPLGGVSAEEAWLLADDNETDLLYNLSIIKDKNISNDKMAPEEAAQLLLRMREPGKEASKDPVSEAIAAGLADNTFRSGVTLEKFAEAVLKAMYYGQYLEVTGISVLQFGRRIGILDGIDTSRMKAALNEDDAVKMVYNALFASPCKFGRIEIDSDTTYMAEILKIYETEGIMTANTDTGLYSGDGVIDAVKIGDDMFYGNEYKEYLGYTVKVYTDKDDNVLYAFPVKKNEETKISAESMESINGTVVKYRGSNDKFKTENVKNGIPVIYNDCYLGPWGSDAVTTKIQNGYGYIDYILLDNDDNGSVDVVFMKKYDSVYITGVHMISNRVADYDELRQKWLYFIDEDKFIMPDGTEAIHENVSDRTVLSFCENDEDTQAFLNGDTDRSPMVFYIADSYIGGIASGISTQDGKDYFSIDNERYELNREYGITAQKAKDDKIQGQDITAYADINGRIIRYELSTGVNYACIAGVYYDEFSQTGRVKLFTTKDKMEIHQIAKNVKMYDPNADSALADKNGNSANSVSGIDLLQKNLPAIMMGIVKIKYNSKGELTSVNLPRKLAYGERGVDNEFNCVTYEERESEGLTTRNGIINDMYIMLGSTAAGVTTQFLKPYNSAEDDEWWCYRSTGTGVKCYNSKFDIYNVDADFCFDMTYSAAESETGNVRTVSAGVLPSVVKNVGEMIMDDGEIGIYADVFYNGSLVQYKASKTNLKSCENEGVEGKLISELDFGDIVQFEVLSNEIIAFRILLDYSETPYGKYEIKEPYTGGVSVDSSAAHYRNASYRMGYGTVKSHGADYIAVTIKGSEYNFWRSRFKACVLVDTESETIEKLTQLQNLKNPKAMFYNFSWGVDQLMAVYQ